MNTSAVLRKTAAVGVALLLCAAGVLPSLPLTAQAAVCTPATGTLIRTVTLDANRDTIAPGELNGRFHHAPTNNPTVVTMPAGNALLVYSGGAWNAWGQLNNQPAQPWLVTTHVRTTHNGASMQHEFPNNNFYGSAGAAQAANAGYATVIPTDGTLRIYIADSVLLNTGSVSWDVYSCAAATPTPTPTATPTPTPAPVSQCQNGLDDDGDGLIDMADPGCSNPNDNNEADGTSQCQDGVDNDNDGAADHPNDFSCSSRQDNDETLPRAQCQDGIDNDNDGLTDMADPGCASRQDNDETHAAATPTPTPESGQASFEVSKSDGHDTVRPGQSLTYTIKIKNTGNRDISDLELVDTVPHHLTITSVTPAALTKTGHVVKWAGIHLSEGETKEFTITAKVKHTTPDNTVLQNTARVASEDFDVKEAATDSTTVKRAKVVVVTGPAIAGATHVPVTAKTGAGSVAGAIMSMIAGGGLMIARKRLV